MKYVVDIRKGIYGNILLSGGSTMYTVLLNIFRRKFQKWYKMRALMEGYEK